VKEEREKDLFVFLDKRNENRKGSSGPHVDLGREPGKGRTAWERRACFHRKKRQEKESPLHCGRGKEKGVKVFLGATEDLRGKRYLPAAKKKKETRGRVEISGKKRRVIVVSRSPQKAVAKSRESRGEERKSRPCGPSEGEKEGEEMATPERELMEGDSVSITGIERNK